jgi:hypothetical protein
VKAPTHRLAVGDLVATWHDATHVCIPGHSCWVACVAEAGRPSFFLAIESLDTGAEAEQWAREQLRQRTGHEAGKVSVQS